MPDDATGELIARLSMEFEPLVDAETVAALVLESRRDLYAAPEPASLQGLEQLARRRLHDARAYAITTVTGAGAAAGSSADLIVRFLTE